MRPQKTPHRNAEKVVKCPVEGCDAEKLARGIHLHVLRSSGNGHGEQGAVPEEVSFDDLEEVGTREVEVNYPKERKVETVARQCPYCKQTFKGKNGVLIHLGQVAGRKNHPPNASKVHVPEDFPVVRLDEDDNIVEVVSDQPATTSRKQTIVQKLEDRQTFAGFTKDEVDYLAEVIEEVDDERAESIIQQAYMR